MSRSVAGSSVLVPLQRSIRNITRLSHTIYDTAVPVPTFFDISKRGSKFIIRCPYGIFGGQRGNGNGFTRTI